MFLRRQCHFDTIYIIYTNYIITPIEKKMNRLHNKHKNTNKKRTCKSNKENRKTLKRRGRSNKKGGSKGCFSCLRCFRGNGVHSRSETKINNEIKQLYIYTIFNGILYYYTREHQYLTTFDTYISKLTSHIAYLNDGRPVPSKIEQDSIEASTLRSHVTDLDSNLNTTLGQGHNSPLVGATQDNRPRIRSEFERVKTAAIQDQPPFDKLKSILDEYVTSITLLRPD
jgi:hypothetical protein